MNLLYETVLERHAQQMRSRAHRSPPAAVHPGRRCGDLARLAVNARSPAHPQAAWDVAGLTWELADRRQVRSRDTAA